MENYIEVIKRIQENPQDEEAVSSLVRDYWAYGTRVARSVLMSAEIYDTSIIEDQLQISWVKVLKNINSLTEPKGFAAWYSRIITNTCIDYTRKASVHKEDSMPQVQYDDEDFSKDIEVIDDTIDHQPEEAYDQQARREIIAEVLNQLSPDQKQIIVMRYYDGLSMKDIAEQLGLPMSTVEGRSRIAQAKIRDSVTEIQKRDDIKLYNLSPLPFFIWLLRDSEEEIKIPHKFVPKIMEEAGSSAASTSAAAAEAVKESSGATSAAVKTAAAGAAKAAGTSGIAKILIGVAVAAAAFGGGYAVVSQSIGNKNSNQSANVEPAESSQPEDIVETEIPEETPEPVKDVIWASEPEYAFTGVRELLPLFPYGDIDVHQELIGYPDEWEYNLTGRNTAGYTGDAIEVIQGNKSGIYDFSGNELYPVNLTKNVLVYGAKDSGAISFAYLRFVLQSDYQKGFSNDFKSVGSYEPGTAQGEVLPEQRKMVNGKIRAFSADAGKEIDSSYNAGVSCLMLEYDGNTPNGWAIVDGHGNLVAHMQTDNAENAYIINKMIRVSKNDQYGFQSSETGKLVVDYMYDDAKYFMDGYAPVKKNGKWGFINDNGDEVTDFIFDDASMLYHGKTYVSVDGVYGVLDLVSTLDQGIKVNEETCHVDPELVQKVADEKADMMIPIGTVTVNVFNLNVRKSPSAKAKLAAEGRSIAEGTVLNVYAVKEAEGYTWYQIDDEKWIASLDDWVTYKEN